jgi:hypothetical protein
MISINGKQAFIARQFDSLTGAYSLNTTASENTIIDDPREYALTLQQAKEILPVNTNVHDAYIQMLLEATTEQVERYIALDTYEKTRRSIWVRPATKVLLPYGIHGAITSVISRTYDNQDTTLVANDDYYVHGSDFKWLEIVSGLDEYLIITFKSGYTAGNCPASIRMGIMQELSLQYKNRQDPNATQRVVVNGLSVEARNLLTPFIRYVL